MIISIDGPAGSGKSTVAKMVSKKLGYYHFNSGSLYRGITAYIIFNHDNKPIDDNFLSSLHLKTEFIDDVQHVFVNGLDLTDNLRDNEVSQRTPSLSSIPSIRKIVDNCQKDFANQNNVVVDGRDIGSFVFPNAEYKFYLDCDISERAKRRFKEEQLKNPNITLQEIEHQIAIRDEIDRNKKIAPLTVPENAIIIDSTHYNAEQVANLILSYMQ